jgi:hypothetical protein
MAIRKDKWLEGEKIETCYKKLPRSDTLIVANKNLFFLE